MTGIRVPLSKAIKEEKRTLNVSRTRSSILEKTRSCYRDSAIDPHIGARSHRLNPKVSSIYSGVFERTWSKVPSTRIRRVRKDITTYLDSAIVP